MPRFSLIEPDRLCREPLLQWAEGTVQGLRATLEESPHDHVRIAYYLNLAAFIESQRGLLDRARTLCESQLHWISRKLRRSSNPVLHELFFQPWINLGRLARIEHRYTFALESFALRDALAAGRDAVLGTFRINADVVSRVEVRRPSVLSFLTTVYIMESLKTYFASGDLESVLAFVERERRTCPEGLRIYLDEAEGIALLRLDRHAGAHAVLSRRSWQKSASVQLYALLYDAGLQAAAGDVEAARRAATTLSILSIAAQAESVRDPNGLRYLEQIAALDEFLGNHQMSEALYRFAHAAARRLRDQPYEIKFIEGILRTPVHHDRLLWETERARLLDECLYAGFSNTSTGAPRPTDRSFEELYDTVMTLAVEGE